jgi:hypothetical protein
MRFPRRSQNPARSRGMLEAASITKFKFIYVEYAKRARGTTLGSVLVP